jgi:endonuclease III
LFWIFAAGKNGTRAASIVNKIVDTEQRHAYLFDTLKEYSLKQLVGICIKYKTGCQTIKARTIHEVVHKNLDLKTCSAADLESTFGIGMKTARCFIIHSRKDAQYAGLDTHMLKHLKSLGYNTPKSTPTRKKYLTLEKIVLSLAKNEGKTPADFDLAVWNKYKIK